MSQAWSGVIMALDNILALFLLPLFGAISDKHTGKRGRRTPFIVFGTIVAAIAFISLSLVDDAQLKNIDAAAAIDDPAALRVVYQQEADRTLKTPDGETFVLEDTFTEDEFAAITSQVTTAEGKTVTNHDYTNYVVPARQPMPTRRPCSTPARSSALSCCCSSCSWPWPRSAPPPSRSCPMLPSNRCAVRRMPSSTSWALPAVSSCWPSAWPSPRAPCATRS